jgi:hypothetical protein
MRTQLNAKQRVAYYNNTYRAELVHRPEQRVVPPEDVERREFSGPCFFCEDRGPCRHRGAESQPSRSTA